jgi:hypothetical protein
VQGAGHAAGYFRAGRALLFSICNRSVLFEKLNRCKTRFGFSLKTDERPGNLTQLF